MRHVAITILGVLFLVLAAACANAGTLSDVPLFSAKRASLAAVADYAFYSGASAPNFPVKKEWRAGFAMGYKLTPGPHQLSLTLGTRYGADSKQFETTLGGALVLWSGTGK